MADNGKKTVEIKENPTKKAPETAGNEGQDSNAEQQQTEAVSFWKHPFTWVKNKAKEHPVATGAVAVTGVGALAFGAKCLIEALSDGKSEDDDEDVLDDVLDENETDEEEEI